MKYTTLDDINVLEALIAVKADKVDHLSRQIADIRSPVQGDDRLPACRSYPGCPGHEERYRRSACLD